MFGTYGKEILLAILLKYSRCLSLCVDVLPRSLSKNERAMICKKNKRGKESQPNNACHPVFLYSYSCFERMMDVYSLIELAGRNV